MSDEQQLIDWGSDPGDAIKMQAERYCAAEREAFESLIERICKQERISTAQSNKSGFERI